MWHFFYFFILQLEALGATSQSWMVLLGQFENLFFSYLLWLMPYKWSRWIGLLILLFMNATHLYLRHFGVLPSGLDLRDLAMGDAPKVFTTFVSMWDGWFYLNLGLSLFIFLPLKRLAFPVIRHKKSAGLVLGGLIVAGFYVQYQVAPSLITRHPLLSFLRSRSLPVWKPTLAFHPQPPARPTQVITGKLQDQLTQWEKSQRGQKKNKILIVLESVGANQFVKAENFPFLHSLKDQMILFERLYTHYPGTTRSHMSLMTGGKYPTRMSLYDFKNYRYQGPSLIRSLKAEGYNTWLVSAMGLEFEELEHFYRDQEPDVLVDPDKIKVPKDKPHPWGVDEETILKETARLFKHQERPFFLTVLTNSTHYPYSFKGTKTVADEQQKYLLACQHTDQVIRQLMQQLKQADLLDQTTVYITADHGESFGEFHPENKSHRNFLYEENIRTFLAIIDSQITSTITITRSGSSADVMPTILGQASGLVNANYQERVHFFHKNTEPLQWGLIEGNEKVILSQVGAESWVFALDQDPHEATNLKSQDPLRLKKQQALIRTWFDFKDNEFRKLIHQ